MNYSNRETKGENHTTKELEINEQPISYNREQQHQSLKNGLTYLIHNHQREECDSKIYINFESLESIRTRISNSIDNIEYQMFSLENTNSSQRIKLISKNSEQYQSQLISEEVCQQNFDEINKNIELIPYYKDLQEAIQNKLQCYDYYTSIYNDIFENIEIFEGKYCEQEVIFKIVYNAKQDEVRKEILILKELEKDNKKKINQFDKEKGISGVLEIDYKILIGYFPIKEQNHYLFIYFKKNFSEIESNLNQLMKSNDIRIWSLDVFNERISSRFQFEQQKKIIIFKAEQHQIIEELGKQNYFLSEYLAEGGEGIVFEGYKKYSIGDYEDVVFKILFDIPVQEIEEEVEILKKFEKNINTIEYKQGIKVSDRIYVHVFERCKYSLQDELNQFLSLEEEFSKFKLLKIIFDLLDALIQLRIYNILHLDIKPANVLINSKGKYVLTDFGISVLNKEDKEIKAKGYSFHFSPQEQIIQCLQHNKNNNDQNNIKNNENITHSSDVYSLGVTLEKVLEVYQEVNPYEDLSEIKQIISDDMLQPQSLNRRNCIDLHNLFYKQLKSHFKQQEITSLQQKYLLSFSDQITSIMHLQPYDHNKDIRSFIEFLLYYQKIDLDIFQNNFLTSQESVSRCLNNIGQTYLVLGDYKNSLEYFSQSLKLRQKYFKRYHSEIAQSQNNVGIAYGNLGEYQKALKNKLKSLKIYKKILYDKHPLFAYTLNSIGITYIDIGQNETALEYLLDSLELYRTSYIGQQPIAIALNNIGVIYKALGDNKNSKSYSEQSLNLQKKLFKRENPDIAATLNNIGITYGDQGDYQNALHYKRQALSIYKRIFKEDHPDIATSHNNVGLAFKDLGDNKSALENLLISLEVRQKIFPANHPDIAESLNNLAAVYGEQGDYDKALKYNIESLEIRRKVFKQNHPDYAASLNNIGICYQKLGKNKESLKKLQKSLKILRTLFKGNHIDIASSLINIGNTYQNLNENYMALQFKLKSLEMYGNIFKGENHPHLAVALNNVGIAYSKLGQLEDSLKYKLMSLEMHRKVSQRDHTGIAASLNNVGLAYQELNDKKIALEYLLESLQMHRNIFKEGHPDLATILDNISIIYEDLGEYGNFINYKLQHLLMVTSLKVKSLQS